MKKALILILAYNAERHIASVLSRIPQSLWNNDKYKSEVVVIDDCSQDATSHVAREYISASQNPIRLLRNEINQGYGGNQKVGYTYAIENGYDAVVMVHGDGQYPPELIPEMIEPLLRGEADAVFGSRMINKKDALAGGMPFYKFAGNIVLTKIQNAMLGSNLSEFHSGFRAYAISALKKIPFQCNSNVFHFDTDIIIQFVDSGLTIKEIPIPTRYGDEVCHVNGMRYALDVMISTLQSRVQKIGIFYTPKYDYKPFAYQEKSSFRSSHLFALSHIKSGDRVLYIGSDDGVIAKHIEEKGAHVVISSPEQTAFATQRFDVILLLDIIDCLPNPEQFLSVLYACCANQNPKIVVTSSNIAFFLQRIMLLFGQFNYAKRGTLDMKHTRFYTFSSLRRIFANSGFNLISIEGIPAPFPLAFGDSKISRLLIKVNCRLIKVSKSLFSYQIAAVLRPMPTLEWLVEHAIQYGDKTN